MTAPSIKEALEPCPFCNTAPAFGRMIEPDQVTIRCNNDDCLVQLCVVSDAESEAVKAWNTRATFQPHGERREAIARLLTAAKLLLQNSIECAAKHHNLHPDTDPRSGWLGHCEDDIKEADLILASGLVQNEAGWRDISTAPKDGTEIIAYRPLAHLTNDPPIIVTKTTSCSRASPQGVEHYTTHWCHPTHWMPLPPPPIRSARDGGAET